MKLLERIASRFGFVTRRQLNARLREATANFQTAQISRLTQSWTQTTLASDAQARMDLKTLRARSRELRDNNDYARKFCTMAKTNVLGESGMHFRNKAKDPDRIVGNKITPGALDEFANRLIEEKFYQWGRKEYCTVTGRLNWCDVQRIVLETAVVDGEPLIRKVIVPKDRNPFGFTLQLIEVDYLDDDYDGVAPNGNQVRMGKERDEWGRITAYWLRDYNPNDTTPASQRIGKRERIPASEIINPFISYRPGQTCGFPWMTTAAYRMNMLGKYEEAEVTAARVAACKMGFFEKDSPNPEYVGDVEGDGKSMEAEPGMFEELPAGMKLKQVDWNHPNSSYQVFMKTALRGVASSLGVSYNSLAEDMESVNFASGKLGLDSERQMWKWIQYWFIESFCEEVFTPWLELAMMNGALDPLPFRKLDKFNQPHFTGRRWDYINPQQEVNARIAMLNAGLTSPSRIAAEMQIDLPELYAEIKADRERAAEYGLHFSEVITEPETPEPVTGDDVEDDTPPPKKKPGDTEQDS